MPQSDTVVRPPVTEWVLTIPKTGESRTFYQSELTIDGEVALLSLATRMVGQLVEMDFPLHEVADLQDADGSLNVPLAAKLTSLAGPIIPPISAESSAIVFGYLPTDDFGRRDPEFDEVQKFIRKALTITRWYDVIQVFMAQNDVNRLIAPFANALRKGVEMGMWAERVKAAGTTSITPESSTNSSQAGTASPDASSAP